MTYCSYNVYQILSLDPTLSLFKQLVDLAGFQATFSNLKYSTVFIPGNQFIKGNVDLYNYLIDPVNISVLQDVLLYSITNVALTTAELVPTRVLTMLNGKTAVIYPTLYYPFLPVVQDQEQQNYNVVEGNIAGFCGVYVQKTNGLLLPTLIKYKKRL